MKFEDLYLCNNQWESITVLNISFISNGKIIEPIEMDASNAAEEYSEYEVKWFNKNNVMLREVTK